MVIENIRMVYNDPKSFMNVANKISSYYYELAHGNKLSVTKLTADLSDTERELVKEFIANYDHSISYTELLKNINERTIEFFKIQYGFDNKKGKDILNSWRRDFRLKGGSDIYAVFQNKINTQLSVINLDRNDSQGKLQTIISSINPYEVFSESDLKNIDPSFAEKNNVINLINSGRAYIKRGNLNDSEDILNKALTRVTNIQKVEKLHIYFYSWILHLLGNICFFRNDFANAESFYSKSYTAKMHIEDIPKEVIYSTQLKLIGLRSFSPSLHFDWNKDILNLYNRVEEYKRISHKENKLLVNNLLGDAAYYLANGYYRSDLKDNFIESSLNAIKMAHRNKDIAGEARAIVLYTMGSKEDNYLTELDRVLKKMDDKIKNDPHVYTILNVYTDNSVPMDEILFKVKDIFSKNNINTTK